MCNRIHIFSFFINFRMNKAFQKHRPALGINRIAITVKFHDIIHSDQSRRERARHQKMIGIGRVAGRDMTETIKHTQISQNPAPYNQIIGYGLHSLRGRCILGLHRTNGIARIAHHHGNNQFH